VHHQSILLNKQRDATSAVVFIIHCKITLHISGGGHDIVEWTLDIGHILTDLNLHHTDT
jgi:hypothetical protein